MTGYKGEEIIAYLKTIKEGDVLTAAKTRDCYFLKGETYGVGKDKDGDLFITDEVNHDRFINVGSDYDCSVKGLFELKVFEIPPRVKDVIYIADVKRDRLGEKVVTVRCNDAGLDVLREVVNKSYIRNNLAELREQSAKLNEEIAKLEGELAE